mmetsp:Transcript_16248/g.50448  ORF Transcript_16248/g.50448 Transcript_16248/m.50448 type:complete len:210 (-) Transcript_16248:1197-1826(-)
MWQTRYGRWGPQRNAAVSGVSAAMKDVTSSRSWWIADSTRMSAMQPRCVSDASRRQPTSTRTRPFAALRNSSLSLPSGGTETPAFFARRRSDVKSRWSSAATARRPRCSTTSALSVAHATKEPLAAANLATAREAEALSTTSHAAWALPSVTRACDRSRWSDAMASATSAAFATAAAAALKRDVSGWRPMSLGAALAVCCCWCGPPKPT